MRAVRLAFVFIALCALHTGSVRAADAEFEKAMAEAQQLRRSQPLAFVAAVEALQQRPTPPDRRQREQLDLLRVHAAMIQSRFGDVLHIGAPLAESAEDPAVRIIAAAVIVNAQSNTRDFVEGQRRLEPLLVEVDVQPDASLRRYVWMVAANFYNQLAQYDSGMRYAERVLANQPDEAERCAANQLSIEARLNRRPGTLSLEVFDQARAHCVTANWPVMQGMLDLNKARWLALQGQRNEAMRVLDTHMAAFEATGWPRLIAEAHAQRGEWLREQGKLGEAEKEARSAMALSSELPSGLALLMARRTLYEIALARGDEALALRQLQALMVVDRAYLQELVTLQEAYQDGRDDSLTREHELALMAQRNAELDLQSRAAAVFNTRSQFLLALLLLGLGSAGVWAWRARRGQRRMRYLAHHDALTGLWTRQQFSLQASAALARAESSSRPMALVLFDLDHFSRVNSEHGHASGDALLQAVAETLKNLEGEGVRFGRIGGEEFACLVHGAGLDEGLTLAERCRVAIAATMVEREGGLLPLRITASFGVVSTTIAGYRLRDLLANADQALYRAKNAGRNRVSAAIVVAVPEAEKA
jgi:diguanylate cyclase (GGDEF)-like protein